MDSSVLRLKFVSSIWLSTREVFGGFGPDEGQRVVVPVFDPLAECVLQCLHTAVIRSLQRLAGDFCQVGCVKFPGQFVRVFLLVGPPGRVPWRWGFRGQSKHAQGAVSQAGMESLAVVKHLYMFGYGHAYPGSSGEGFLVVHFVFQRREKLSAAASSRHTPWQRAGFHISKPSSSTTTTSSPTVRPKPPYWATSSPGATASAAQSLFFGST